MRHDVCAARLRAALQQGDELALASVLNPEIRLSIDAGDETGGEVHGRARVIRVLRERLANRADAAIDAVHVNGAPALALRRTDGQVLGVLSFDLGGGTIERLWLTTSAGKLSHWNR
ncbi:hypothetical protein J2X63_000799 [Agromyces sp. 3263]|uniref:hypothetical protein n=1 Tax=Agromyces sp. 3263 TaxID=2817750 RepID=UPI00285828BB|nr:hypothetical protein [Agromyces sp. 3263]MDR6905113.1 hypothetical protein [Agromyces sp. 3263]